MDRHRERIGVVMPSNNTVLEGEIDTLLPEGLGADYALVRATGVDVDALRAMSNEAEDAARGLTGVDVLLYACASTSYTRGPAWNGDFADRLGEVSGAPCVTAASAVVIAAAALGVRRVGVVTPYPAEVHAVVAPYLEAFGIEVASDRTLGIADMHEVGRRPAEDVFQLALEVTPGAQALLVLGSDLVTLPILDGLERTTGLPVITTNQAMVWAALGILGVQEGVTGAGTLLRDFPPSAVVPRHPTR